MFYSSGTAHALKSNPLSLPLGKGERDFLARLVRVVRKAWRKNLSSPL